MKPPFRGVASVALRSLAIAAECLTSRREQEEVLEIFQKIKRETGWRVDFLHKELKEKWSWDAPASAPPPPPPPPATTMLNSSLMAVTTAPHELSTFQTHHAPQMQQPQYQHAHQAQAQAQAQYTQIRRLPQMVNPLMAVADLTNGHPYHPHYVSAPSQQHIEQRHQYM